VARRLLLAAFWLAAAAWVAPAAAQEGAASGPTPSPEAPTSATPSPAPEPAGRIGGVVGQASTSVGVSAVDDAFRPMQLTVTVGTEVVWTNEGDNPHTVTADDRSFDSGTLEGGQTFSVVFEEPGRVPYYCQIHGEPGSGMFGVVIVRPAAAAEEDTPAPEGPLARTGSGPLPLALVALVLLAGGALVLRGAKRLLADAGDGSVDTEGRRRG